MYGYQGPKHCKDCGGELDPFGICIWANAETAANAKAPVYCGKTPQQAALLLEALTAVLQSSTSGMVN